MSRMCDICGKKPMTGFNVSKAYNHTKRRFMPNLQKISIVENGVKKRITACTRCIRTGKIQKAAR